VITRRARRASSTRRRARSISAGWSLGYADSTPSGSGTPKRARRFTIPPAQIGGIGVSETQDGFGHVPRRAHRQAAEFVPIAVANEGVALPSLIHVRTSRNLVNMTSAIAAEPWRRPYEHQRNPLLPDPRRKAMSFAEAKKRGRSRVREERRSIDIHRDAVACRRREFSPKNWQTNE